MNQSEGELIGIAFRSGSRKPMQQVDRADVTPERGVLDDFRGKPGPRQVTVLAVEAWEAACRELDKQLPWTHRRANLYVRGIDLKESAGAVIWLGDVGLRVTGETDPCSRMEEAEPGLETALLPDWRGGACCRVIQGGEIYTSMPVRIEPATDR